MTTEALRTSPLDAAHRALGAKLTEFGGWDMPLSYPAGTIAEHHACRSGAVVFDVSHLGTVRVEGPEALGRLQAAFTNDLARIAPGRAQYTHLLDPDDASVVDDIIVWWVDDGRFDVMPNASNTAGVRDALGVGEDADVTTTRAILAVQGPEARSAVAAHTEGELPERMRTATLTVAGHEALVCGTGY
nr:glycine cleavage system protein T [Actinomycetota bacterium]